MIDEYGSGAKPIVAAGTSDADAVYLLNQQYWEINDLEITNKQSAVGDYRGISINGQDGGTLNHIYIRNCFVHDVTGEVNWIGGDTADNAPGITFQTGWDASKSTGGIVFDVQAGSANGQDEVQRRPHRGEHRPGLLVRRHHLQAARRDRALGDAQLGDELELDPAHQRDRARELPLPAQHELRAATRST